MSEQEFLNLLNILFVASRNTMMKTFNHSLFKKIRKKKGIFRNPKDNTYLFRNYRYLNEFGDNVHFTPSAGI